MGRVIRLVFVLLVVPAVALWMAWRLLPTLPLPDTAAPDAVQVPGAAADGGGSGAAAVVERWIDPAGSADDRLALAEHCLRQALRVSAPDLRRARLMLVVLTDARCERDCEAERIAEAVNDHYTLEGLRVMLLRTDPASRLDSPMGVTTVVTPECAPLLGATGSDWFLRWPDGRIGSGGERHAALARAPEPGDGPPAFDPEPAIRAEFNLRPRPRTP